MSCWRVPSPCQAPDSAPPPHTPPHPPPLPSCFQQVVALKAYGHNESVLQCAGAAVASIILKGLDSTGYTAAAGAANQLNSAAGVTVGRALGFEIMLT